MEEQPAQRAKRRQLSWAVGALVLGPACWLPACRRADTSTAGSPPTTLRVGVSVGQMATASSQAGIRQVAQNLSVEGLLNVGEDGRLIPMLAKSWEYTREGRTLRVHLRPGVTFHNGAPVTAATVVKILEGA